MASPTERVMQFIGFWEARNIDGIVGALAPDIKYHNIPMPLLSGREAVRAFAAPFLDTADSVVWTVHHIAETPDGAVLTERTDTFHMKGGKTISIRVMGTFEFDDAGLISAWRDYFDLAEFQSQMA